MKQAYCPFESTNNLLMCAGGIQAILEHSDFDSNVANEVKAVLNTAARAWVDDLALATTNSVAHNPSDTASFYSDVVKNIAAASTLLNKAGNLLPPEAHEQLAESQAAASHYLEHREALRKYIKEQPESRERLLAYFGDMLVS